MNTSFLYLRRLDFELPDFLRLAWVNDHAREVWTGRFQRLVRAWVEIESLSLLYQIRDCALVRVSGGDYERLEKRLEQHGFKAAPISPDPLAKASDLRSLQVIVGAPQHVSRLQEALLAEDHSEVGRLLGYPACCRTMFDQWCSREKLLDPTWFMAAATADIRHDNGLVEIEAGAATNMLLRWIGIRPIAHLPCNCRCEASLQLAKRFFEVGVELGFQMEMDWLQQVLSWPMEWSGLHGIAEIKTPVMKICTRTDATAEKLVVRWKGAGYPEEGVQGVAFPYRTPMRPLTTGSPSFQRALQGAPGFVQIQPMGK
jgi:hypothetical protein